MGLNTPNMGCFGLATIKKVAPKWSSMSRKVLIFEYAKGGVINPSNGGSLQTVRRNFQTFLKTLALLGPMD